MIIFLEPSSFSIPDFAEILNSGAFFAHEEGNKPKVSVSPFLSGF
jgi:hypothetical protein